MKKFEVGNRYYESGLTFEITGRKQKFMNGLKEKYFLQQAIEQ
jgi:hypothetical protein